MQSVKCEHELNWIKGSTWERNEDEFSPGMIRFRNYFLIDATQ